MTKEEKNLLIKDLCGRLSYGVKGLALGGKVDTINVFVPTEFPWVKTTTGLVCHLDSGQFKPYLRPMSSMTEEEIYEYNKLVELDRSNKELFNILRIEYIQNHPEYKNMPFVPMYRHIDYLNTIHLDYRGLILMGLALPAPEGMYKN